MPTRPRVLAGAGVGAYPGPHCGPPAPPGAPLPSSPLHPALGPDNHLAQETGPSGSLTPREPPGPPGPCLWTRWEGPRTHPDHTWPPAPAHRSGEGPIIPQFLHLQKEHEETVKLSAYRWTPPTAPTRVDQGAGPQQTQARRRRPGRASGQVCGAGTGQVWRGALSTGATAPWRPEAGREGRGQRAGLSWTCPVRTLEPLGDGVRVCRWGTGSLQDGPWKQGPPEHGAGRLAHRLLVSPGSPPPTLTHRPGSHAGPIPPPQALAAPSRLLFAHSHAFCLWRALGAEQPVSRQVLAVLLAWLQERALPPGPRDGSPQPKDKPCPRSLAVSLCHYPRRRPRCHRVGAGFTCARPFWPPLSPGRGGPRAGPWKPPCPARTQEAGLPMGGLGAQGLREAGSGRGRLWGQRWGPPSTFGVWGCRSGSHLRRCLLQPPCSQRSPPSQLPSSRGRGNRGLTSRAGHTCPWWTVTRQLQWPDPVFFQAETPPTPKAPQHTAAQSSPRPLPIRGPSDTCGLNTGV